MLCIKVSATDVSEHIKVYCTNVCEVSSKYLFVEPSQIRFPASAEQVKTIQVYSNMNWFINTNNG